MCPLIHSRRAWEFALLYVTQTGLYSIRLFVSAPFTEHNVLRVPRGYSQYNFFFSIIFYGGGSTTAQVCYMYLLALLNDGTVNRIGRNL